MPSETEVKNAAIAAKTAVLAKIPKELLDRSAAPEPHSSTAGRGLKAAFEVGVVVGGD